MTSDFVKHRPFHTITHGKIKDRNPVGFCWCKLHRGYLLANHLKKHKCMTRGCVWFQKNEDHPLFQTSLFEKNKRDAFCKIKGFYFDGIIDCRTWHTWRSELTCVHSQSELDEFMAHHKKGE